MKISTPLMLMATLASPLPGAELGPPNPVSLPMRSDIGVFAGARLAVDIGRRRKPNPVRAELALATSRVRAGAPTLFSRGLTLEIDRTKPVIAFADRPLLRLGKSPPAGSSTDGASLGLSKGARTGLIVAGSIMLVAAAGLLVLDDALRRADRN